MTDHFATDSARADELIVVDGLDRPIGTATKERIHAQGLLHRAFSVVITRERAGRRELLLSQRALDKYHSAGLWANTCCSHPRVGERVVDAASRRLAEELGICVPAVDLHEIGAFVYRAPFDNGLCEYEYDHVLLASFDGACAPNPAEVASTRWVAADDVARELAEHPERFAAWAFTVLSLALRS